MDISIANPIWKRGRPAELFVAEEAFIEKFINEYKLQALPEISLDQLAPLAGVVVRDARFTAEPQLSGVQEQHAPNMAVRDTTRKFPIKPQPFPGGLKTPHIHFRGDVFMLDNRQWQDFSSFIKKDIQERLDRAESIPFEQMMDIAGSVRGL